MSEILSKTAPCLLEDLHDYNFRGSFIDLFHPKAPKSACQHSYSTNEDRSTIPLSWDEKSEPTTSWTLALTCRLCRVHVDIKIDFGETQLACPSQNFPLHHFSFVGSHSQPDNAYPRQYQFKCSYEYCHANLWVVFKLPELREEEITHLINVKARMKAALERAPKTKDRNPLESLDVLRKYISDALKNSERTIPTDNGAFVSCLGDGAGNMLARLGFALIREESGKPAWKLPQPPLHKKLDFEFDLTRCLLEDVREELTVLIQARPESEKRGNISDLYPPPPRSKRDLGMLLGGLEYEKLRQAYPRHHLEALELFSGLGALSDYEDSLVAWCYDQQCRTDPLHGPFFFRCLKRIAEIRESEDLTTKALTLESQGLQTDTEIAEAFGAIGIEISHEAFLNDENILSRYRSRFQDSGEEEKQRMRHALSIIAEHRQSVTLRDASKGSESNAEIKPDLVCKERVLTAEALETYEQALAFLGADAETLDEFVLALKTAKEQENPADKQSVLKAVEIVARTRNSSVLHAHLQQENQPAQTMDISTAYNIFNATPSVDSDTLTLAFPGLLHDNPESRNEIIRAMKTIAEARGHSELLQQAESAQVNNVLAGPHPIPLTDPRGLENIGNTCYLNSFLQYIFTIRPLRELVENMVQYRQDLSEEALAVKRVGDERVAKHQVLRAQSFVHELNILFESLKTSHHRAVTLDRNLAALTVAPTGDWTASREQEKRRRSTMVGSKGPKLAVSTSFSPDQVSSSGSPDGNVVITESPRDERQLLPIIDDVAAGYKCEDDGTVGKGHNEASDANTAMLLEAQEARSPIEGEPMTIDGQSQVKADDVGINGEGSNGEQPETPIESGKALSDPDPPPIPPRPETKTSKQFKDASTEKIEEWARQQDMREALANVFRQLRWAIKDEADSEGEQIDLISRLFYGKENIVTLKDNGEKVTETIPFHSLYVIPDESYRNFYGMLDGAYGFRDIAGESLQDQRSQYSTFSDIPPILHVDVAVTAWDKEAQHAVRRAPFKVAESFYMDRYMDDSKSIETRKRVSELMSELDQSKQLLNRLTKNEIGIDLPNALRNAGVYLGELLGDSDMIEFDAKMIPESLVTSLDDLGDESSHQLSIVSREMERAAQELSTSFPDEGSLLYRLHAVCMHTGRADSGHYFIYIYDSDEKRWYKYNDETVERIENTQPVLDPNGGVRDGIPAMLVYVRDGEMKNLMQTVCREPGELAQDSTLIQPKDSSNPKPVNPAPWDQLRHSSPEVSTNW